MVMSDTKTLINKACGYTNIRKNQLAKQLNMSPSKLWHRMDAGRLSSKEWNEIESALNSLQDNHVKIRVELEFADGTIIK